MLPIKKQNIKLFIRVMLIQFFGIIFITIILLNHTSRDSLKDQFLFYLGLISIFAACIDLITGILFLFEKDKKYSVCFFISSLILFLMGYLSLLNAQINWGFWQRYINFPALVRVPRTIIYSKHGSNMFYKFEIINPFLIKKGWWIITIWRLFAKLPFRHHRVIMNIVHLLFYRLFF